MIVQRARGVANGIPVVTVNRVGHEPDPSGQTRGISLLGLKLCGRTSGVSCSILLPTMRGGHGSGRHRPEPVGAGAPLVARFCATAASMPIQALQALPALSLSNP